jgi:hypothetical protein
VTTDNHEIALTTPDEPGDNDTQPTSSWSDAKRSGMTTHEIYVLTAKIRITVVRFHQRAGTPRNLWEATELAGSMLSDFYNTKATGRLETACQEDLDPLIQRIEDQSERSTPPSRRCPSVTPG